MTVFHVSLARIGRFHSKSSITGKSECFHLLICLTVDFFFFFFASSGKSRLSFVLFCSSLLPLTTYPFVNFISKTAHPNNWLPLKTLASPSATFSSPELISLFISFQFTGDWVKICAHFSFSLSSSSDSSLEESSKC